MPSNSKDIELNMDPHILNGSYSNDCAVPENDSLDRVLQIIEDYTHDYHPFFVGLCYVCYSPGSTTKPLKRCGGCQLVAYCSRLCQKSDWRMHKHICKEFPIVKGKNVLCTTGSWKKHIKDLHKRADKLADMEKKSAQAIFNNPRVCKMCHEARSDCLTDCKCGYVSYCSNRCIMADNQHERDCLQLSNIGKIYSGYNNQRLLPSVRESPISDVFTIASSWEDILPSRYKTAMHVCEVLHGEKAVDFESISDMERLSYPMSILNALQMLPGRRISQNHQPLEDLTTLDIHVVTSSPLLDSEPWEVFMHRLPKLKSLNVTFILQGKGFRQSFYKNNKPLTLLRCNDCKNKGRIITYSIQQMPYHMYFSSPEYTEPDVVGIFGNSKEMLSTKNDDIHSDISYHNMTYNPNTVLFLTDATIDLLIQGFKAVNAVQPVEMVVPIQSNELSGFSTSLAGWETGSAIDHERLYLTCLRRKQ